MIGSILCHTTHGNQGKHNKWFCQCDMYFVTKLMQIKGFFTLVKFFCETNSGSASVLTCTSASDG
jgi:hypothetical protein